MPSGRGLPGHSNSSGPTTLSTLIAAPFDAAEVATSVAHYHDVSI
jgi:hypothetical protein